MRIHKPSRCSYSLPVTDKDTIFFFNYRSDRMREIVSVFGLDPKPMEVSVPKDLVSPCLAYIQLPNL